MLLSPLTNKTAWFRASLQFRTSQTYRRLFTTTSVVTITNQGLIPNLIKVRTVLTVFFLLLLFPPKAYAQTTSLAIWPPLLEATIQPGKTITQVFRLKNLGDDTTITAQVIPFSPADELGHVKLLGYEPNNNFFSLINADIEKNLPATFPLKAGQTQELVLKIHIPKTSQEDDHYFTFLFSSTTTGLIGGTGTTTEASIGSNVLLTISTNGQPQRTAKIEEFRTYSGYKLSKKFTTFSFPNLNLLDSFSPFSFLLRVKNTGTARFKAIGQIEIKNTFQKKVITLPIRQDNILINSTRKLQSDNWNPIFPLGRYTATATITPKDSNNPISQTINFFVFPYKLILISFTIYLIYRLLTKYRTPVKIEIK